MQSNDSKTGEEQNWRRGDEKGWRQIGKRHKRRMLNGQDDEWWISRIESPCSHIFRFQGTPE